MQTENDTPKPEDSPEQVTGEGCPEATCSPSSIYLQWNGDEEPSDRPVCITEVTWHWESIFPHDVQYIRADLVAMLIREIDSCLSIPANVLPPMNMLDRILSENSQTSGH